MCARACAGVCGVAFTHTHTQQVTPDRRHHYPPPPMGPLPAHRSYGAAATTAIGWTRENRFLTQRRRRRCGVCASSSTHGPSSRVGDKIRETDESRPPPPQYPFANARAAVLHLAATGDFSRGPGRFQTNSCERSGAPELSMTGEGGLLPGRMYTSRGFIGDAPCARLQLSPVVVSHGHGHRPSEPTHRRRAETRGPCTRFRNATLRPGRRAGRTRTNVEPVRMGSPVRSVSTVPPGAVQKYVLRFPNACTTLL